MSESVPRPPASWVLNEKTKATVLRVIGERTDLLIERLHGPGAAVLSVTVDGRMLVNFQDVDLGDDFPAYLGYFDIFSEMGEHVQPGASVIMDEENLVQHDTESYMGLMYQIDILARRAAGITNIDEAYTQIIEMLATVRDDDRAEDSSPIPFQGELSEPLVKMIKEVIVVMAANMTEEGAWDDEALQNLQINNNNTWALPGTFHTVRGHWQMTTNGVSVSFDTED